MNNIVLVGLTRDLNLGDPLIFECTRDFLKKSFTQHKKQYELRDIDLYGRTLEKRRPVYYCKMAMLSLASRFGGVLGKKK